MEPRIEIIHYIWLLFFNMTHRLYVLAFPKVDAPVDIDIKWLALGQVSMLAE